MGLGKCNEGSVISRERAGVCEVAVASDTAVASDIGTVLVLLGGLYEVDVECMGKWDVNSRGMGLLGTVSVLGIVVGLLDKGDESCKVVVLLREARLWD
ncbi:hypothetical protein FCV25MIE_19591 [Fagus crenata]